VLELNDVSVLRSGRRILDRISLKIGRGELIALLGPNGAGKTTLLRVASGELAPDAGSAALDGRELQTYSAQELARKRSVLSQSRGIGFAYRAREVVALGRYAYAPRDPEGPDRIDHALEIVGATHLANRMYSSLSGGEAVKIDVARILAQESSIVFLDEPTNHLDVRVQYDVLALFHGLAQRGISVVAALHELNHAALFADRVVLMKSGEIVADGLSSVVLNPNLLQQVYGLPCSLAHARDGRRFIVPDLLPASM